MLANLPGTQDPPRSDGVGLWVSPKFLTHLQNMDSMLPQLASGPHLTAGIWDVHRTVLLLLLLLLMMMCYDA